MHADYSLACLSRDAYRPDWAGVAVDWKDMRVILVANTLAVRGTNSYANAKRDAEVSAVRTHPELGPCVAGALDAAEGLLPLIPAGVDTITGHSLGGQVAVLLAAMLPGVKLLVTWDAPKAGGDILADRLSAIEARQYAFRGSVVTDWPLAEYEHVRSLQVIGAWTPNLVTAHSIDRACAWLAG